MLGLRGPGACAAWPLPPTLGRPDATALPRPARSLRFSLHRQLLRAAALPADARAAFVFAGCRRCVRCGSRLAPPARAVNVSTRPSPMAWQQLTPPEMPAPARARRFSGGRTLLPLALESAAQEDAPVSRRWRLGVAVLAVVTLLGSALAVVGIWSGLVTHRGD